jgi:hypothetical protein
MTLVLACDLGLNVGLVLVEPNTRPRVHYFRIPYPARDLGRIAQFFVQKVRPIIKKYKPDHIVRATRFINKVSNPIAIGPYFGLSMRLDELAEDHHIDHFEVIEGQARAAFLGKVPRGSEAIKDAIRAACVQRNYPTHDEHTCDAIVVGTYALSILVPSHAVTSTPLFTAVYTPDDDPVRIIAYANLKKGIPTMAKKARKKP